MMHHILSSNWSYFEIIVLMILCYFMSHLLRMLRLLFLTLDQRKKIIPVITSHGISALVCSAIPYKLGELLRLYLFILIYSDKNKAIAVWLTERFGDVITLILFVLILYLSGIEITPILKIIMLLFILLSSAAIVSFIAINMVSRYLYLNLLLTTISKRSYKLLGFAYALRSLERTIHKTLEGRTLVFILLSIMIWTFEIFAFMVFIYSFHPNINSYASKFFYEILIGVPNQIESDTPFTVYQLKALVILMLVSLIIYILTKTLKKKNGWRYFEK